jgi:hypothetical protein
MIDPPPAGIDVDRGVILARKVDKKIGHRVCLSQHDEFHHHSTKNSASCAATVGPMFFVRRDETVPCHPVRVGFGFIDFCCLLDAGNAD